MTVRLISKCAGVAMVLGLAACGPGNAYDNLAGGSKTDSALEAPRPISPVSISLISSSRPRLKWELGGLATGAIVEMCRTRACDGEIKTFNASGRELVVPEDLAPRIWFWRLRSRADGKDGTKTSPTWEMLVRGPAAHGSSDAPAGSMIDYDGDGIPDLLSIGDTAMDPNEAPWPELVVFHADDASTFRYEDKLSFYQIANGGLESTPVAIAGGIDLDGDGYADMMYAANDDEYGGYVDYEFGGATPFDENKSNGTVPGAFKGLMSVREAGDVDGDGYGDLLAGDPGSVALHLGGPKGPASSVPIMVSLPGSPAKPAMTRPIALAAAFDSNGDGFGDVAFGFPDKVDNRFTVTALASDKKVLHAANQGSDEPYGGTPPSLVVATGSVSRVVGLDSAREVTVRGMSNGLPHQITFASGDFNGDGISDVAATIEGAGTRKLCVWFGDEAHIIADGPCVDAASYDNLLGEQLAAADLEGDGVDELLAVSSEDGASVKVFRFDGAKMRAAEKIPSLGAAITTIWPGRPGKARWAARSADGRTVKVFEGTDVIQTLRAPPEVLRGFGRTLR